MKKLFGLIGLCVLGLLSAQQAGVQRKWMLTNLRGFTRTTLIKNQVYLDLTKTENGQVNAYAGCNTLNMTADYSGKSRGHLRFRGITTSRMLCNDRGLEAKYLRQLQAVRRYQLKGKRLYLYTANGQVMRLNPAN